MFVRFLPVCNVLTVGEREVLQSGQEERGLGDSCVCDSSAVAEGQAGQTGAVAGDRSQAGVTDLRQQGQRQALELWMTQHLT